MTECRVTGHTTRLTTAFKSPTPMPQSLGRLAPVRRWKLPNGTVPQAPLIDGTTELRSVDMKGNGNSRNELKMHIRNKLPIYWKDDRVFVRMSKYNFQ